MMDRASVSSGHGRRTVTSMSERILTGGLLVAYLSLRGTGRALAALESVVASPAPRAPVRG
jgi:hypothetical protein